MIKVGLKKELESKRSKSITKADDFLKESRLLLEHDSSEEANALRTAGLDHHVRVVENDRGIEIEREQFEGQYGDMVFTNQEIKEICFKYDLRLLESKYFKAKLDSQISYKLKNFIKSNPEVGNVSDSFYIIAPENAFDLENRPAKPFLVIDPILLYKVPTEYGEESKYVYIHKWGRDFTIARRLRGIFFKSTENMWTITASFWIVALSVIFGTFFSGFTGMWYQYLNLIWITGLSFGLSLATLAILFNEGENFIKRTTDYTWNSRTKRRR